MSKLPALPKVDTKKDFLEKNCSSYTNVEIWAFDGKYALVFQIKVTNAETPYMYGKGKSNTC